MLKKLMIYEALKKAQDKSNKKLVRQVKTDVCRMCLASNVRMVGIFDCVNRNLAKDIQFCTGIVVQNSGNLSKKICTECLAHLKMAYIFKTKCIKTDKKLKNKSSTVKTQLNTIRVRKDLRKEVKAIFLQKQEVHEIPINSLPDKKTKDDTGMFLMSQEKQVKAETFSSPHKKPINTLSSNEKQNQENAITFLSKEKQTKKNAISFLAPQEKPEKTIIFLAPRGKQEKASQEKQEKSPQEEQEKTLTFLAPQEKPINILSSKEKQKEENAIFLEPQGKTVNILSSKKKQKKPIIILSSKEKKNQEKEKQEKVVTFLSPQEKQEKAVTFLSSKEKQALPLIILSKEKQGKPRVIVPSKEKLNQKNTVSFLASQEKQEKAVTFLPPQEQQEKAITLEASQEKQETAITFLQPEEKQKQENAITLLSSQEKAITSLPVEENMLKNQSFSIKIEVDRAEMEVEEEINDNEDLIDDDLIPLPLKQENQFEETEEPPTCYVCNIEFPTHADREWHYYEEQHKAKINEILGRKPVKRSLEERTVQRVKGVQRVRVKICEICGTKVIGPQKIWRHDKMHKPPEFMCDKCDYTTWFLTDFKRHLMGHSEEKQYQCGYCARMFTYCQNLYVHIRRMHEKDGARTYECKKCDNKYTNSNALRRHTIMHLNARNFECKVCYSRFNIYKHLKRHMLNLHKITLPKQKCGRQRNAGFLKTIDETDKSAPFSVFSRNDEQ